MSFEGKVVQGNKMDGIDENPNDGYKYKKDYLTFRDILEETEFPTELFSDDEMDDWY